MNICKLKDDVRARDGYRCTKCGMTADEHRRRYGKTLDTHRIVPGSPYTMEGCQTLCKPCHRLMPKSRWGSSPTPTVHIYTETYNLAKGAAGLMGVSVTEFLRNAVRPAAEKVIAQAARGIKKGDKEKGSSE